MKLGKTYTYHTFVFINRTGFLCELPSFTSLNKLCLLLNLLFSLSIFAQYEKDSALYISPKTVILGLELIYTAPQHNDNIASRDLDINLHSKNNTPIYIYKNTSFCGIEKSNLVFLEPRKGMNAQTHFKAHKGKAKITPKEKPKQEVMVANISPCPLGNYPIGQYNSLSMTAVTAPASPSFSKKTTNLVAPYTFCLLGKKPAQTPNKTFFGYTNPGIAQIITVSSSNRPPPCTTPTSSNTTVVLV